MNQFKKEVLNGILEDNFVKVLNKVTGILEPAETNLFEAKAMRLYGDCTELKGQVVMAYWADALTKEEYDVFFSIASDMANDAHDLAYFGHFL